MNTESVIVCTDSVASFLGVFDLSIAPQLLFYSYIPIIFVSLILGFFVLSKDNLSLLSKTFFSITLLFSLFIANELVQWLAVPVGLVYFSWSLGLLLNYLVVIATFYFVYLFVQKEDLTFSKKFLLAALTFPVILFLPTKLNLVAFDPDWCGALTGKMWNYLYFTELLFATILFAWGTKLYTKYRTDTKNIQPSSILLLFGSSIFLLIYFASYYFADSTGVYGINLSGPLGMIIFIVTISFLIVKFRIFKNIKLIAAQALVLTLLLLLGSLLFVIEDKTTKIVIFITLVFATLACYFLIKSIKKEVAQRQKIESLAINLEKANERLKQMDKLKSEFISIASHQLRSPITAISGYASLIGEGSYGEVPKKMKDPIERIVLSARMMADSIEDYLNVSRIESGNMKYNYVDFNLADQTEHICDDLRPEALKRGLILLFRKRLESQGIINSDLGKVQQIVHNLINNSIKYTPKGAITVYVHDDAKNKKIFIDILDTGIGMNTATLNSIFQKFERGDAANTVNVRGTGLGLYVALKMAQAMRGDITAHSDGEGKGSRFTIELPLAM